MNLFHKLFAKITTKTFILKLFILILSLFAMAASLAFLRKCNWGLDPGSFMTQSLALFTGIRFGIFSLIIYGAMLLIVIIFSPKLIGLGTLLNVLIIGNGSDFFLWIAENHLDGAIFFDQKFIGVKIAIFAASILLFVVGTACYIKCNLGLSPYDALPAIAHKKLFKKLPFAAVRVPYDALVISVGIIFCVKKNPHLLNSTLGTFILMATIGPAISAVGTILSRHSKLFKEQKIL